VITVSYSSIQKVMHSKKSWAGNHIYLLFRCCNRSWKKSVLGWRPSILLVTRLVLKTSSLTQRSLHQRSLGLALPKKKNAITCLYVQKELSKCHTS